MSSYSRLKKTDLNGYTTIYRGYYVEHYEAADSALVYTDYCYTPKMYAELLKKYEGLTRNAGPVRNARVRKNSEFCKIAERPDLKSEAQKEF